METENISVFQEETVTEVTEELDSLTMDSACQTCDAWPPSITEGVTEFSDEGIEFEFLRVNQQEHVQRINELTTTFHQQLAEKDGKISGKFVYQFL